MLALSLLLCAAAGVNAVLDGKVETVRISDKEFICATDCTFRGAFLGQSGRICTEPKAIVRLDKDGKVDDEWYGTAFECPGEVQFDGHTTRERSGGETPLDCLVEKMNDPDFFRCTSSKGGDRRKVVDWADIEKELKLKTAEKKKRTQGGRNKCGKAAQEVYSECTRTGESQECEEKSRAFMESCLDGE
ncbi:hypothetical protein G3M48_006371 [Beauveria asiatica]|uniref:Uncharacterized protein n=1 Tax=Beauveria asiatica TaxID=1069075 RepID=A0AAW0RPP9_9HYPO